jgi:hypothetical protein
VATFVYASSQGQRTHSAQIKIEIWIKPMIIFPFLKYETVDSKISFEDCFHLRNDGGFPSFG